MKFQGDLGSGLNLPLFLRIFGSGSPAERDRCAAQASIDMEHSGFSYGGSPCIVAGAALLAEILWWGLVLLPSLPPTSSDASPQHEGVLATDWAMPLIAFTLVLQCLGCWTQQDNGWHQVMFTGLMAGLCILYIWDRISPSSGVQV